MSRPGSAASQTRWPVGWGLRLFAATGLAFMLYVGSMLAFVGARTSDRVGGFVFLTVLPLAAWVFFVRPVVELSGSWLYVRNPVRSHYIPIANVKDAEPLNTGLGLELADGTQVTAWALQQGLLLSLMSWDTRTDRARSMILASARAARRDDAPQHR